MPVKTTAVPRQKPRSTPAAVETMLDGTGRNTSAASNARMPPAASQRGPPPCDLGGKLVELGLEQEERHQHDGDQNDREYGPTHRVTN